EVSFAMIFTFAGTGTARSAVLDYLGIGGTEKAVVVSIFSESDENIIMRALREKMALYLVGRGISFTVPLTGISEIVANGITGAATNKTMEGSRIMYQQDRKYDLIVAAMAANCVDEAMEAARAAGAAGGTVIRARALKNEKAEQFIGISLTQEQELLLILTKREGKLAIMNALSEKVGLKTEAGGVIFSLPVDKTAGISATDEAEPVAEEQ
ncbi:MAG: P-II family nitrogen regulator, partial [Clostridiales bacterium]|nr:P-II family nitrogen regulator [Clostridiales bacterium]